MLPKCPQCGASLPTGALAGLCPACLLQQGVAADTARQPEAKPFIPPPVEEVARLFPQLEILGFPGKGGMGAVYKARQPALDRLVALKILPAQSAPDPGFAERFTREAGALARLSHPNIVAVHEFGQVSPGSAGVPPASLPGVSPGSMPWDCSPVQGKRHLAGPDRERREAADMARSFRMNFLRGLKPGHPLDASSEARAAQGEPDSEQ
jgi:hypothetical protein